MEIYVTWIYIIVTVLVALIGNTLSAIWIAQSDKFKSVWLYILILFSPFVFITFGLTSAKIGLAVGSAVADSMLVIGTILVGLFVFKEYRRLNLYQILGIFLSVIGLFLVKI